MGTCSKCEDECRHPQYSKMPMRHTSCSGNFLTVTYTISDLTGVADISVNGKSYHGPYNHPYARELAKVFFNHGN